MENYYAVIMAGGGGTRLWPVSRKSSPKQAVSLIGKDNLFQIAFQRLSGLFPPERILVVTTEDQAGLLRGQCPEIPQQNFLLEPQPKGTASVVGLAAAVLSQRAPGSVMAVLTADHFIANVPKFQQLLKSAYHAARQGKLVTLGITPTSPSTAYGYIQSGEVLGNYEGQPVLQVVRFKEKPSLQQATQMLADGDHTWNSGMFIWQVQDIQAEIARQMPELYHHLQIVAQAWDTPQRSAVLQQAWAQLHNVTIDYGIMEGASGVVVIPAQDLGWNDVGSWDSLYEMLPLDENGNISAAEQTLTLETQNTLIFSNQPGRLVVTVGVSDLMVIDTGDAVLVCHKNQAQKVRQVVEQLKVQFPDKL